MTLWNMKDALRHLAVAAALIVLPPAYGAEVEIKKPGTSLLPSAFAPLTIMRAQV